MKIEFWVIGKTKEKYLNEGFAIYFKRLKHYTRFAFIEIPNVKDSGKLSPENLKIKEGEIILSKLSNDDYLVLLDEKGKEYSSVAFSIFLQNHMVRGKKKLIFLVGGAFGFSSDVYTRANLKLSLSKMTFSHQMIRLFFVEQLYRAFTIIRGEGYHND